VILQIRGIDQSIGVQPPAYPGQALGAEREIEVPKKRAVLHQGPLISVAEVIQRHDLMTTENGRLSDRSGAEAYDEDLQEVCPSAKRARFIVGEQVAVTWGVDPRE
jgi:hypothetical protein